MEVKNRLEMMEKKINLIMKECKIPDAAHHEVSCLEEKTNLVFDFLLDLNLTDSEYEKLAENLNTEPNYKTRKLLRRGDLSDIKEFARHCDQYAAYSNH